VLAVWVQDSGDWLASSRNCRSPQFASGLSPRWCD
jgi:hypothetical protein